VITLVEFGHQGQAALEGALARLGYRCSRAAHPDQAAPAGPVLVAGMGPLDQACADLKASGWWRSLPDLAGDGRAVLGIGVGLHLLAEGSEECPRGSGLGLIPGIVRRLGPGAKVPHWGWSRVQARRTHPLLSAFQEGWLFFAHCHALDPTSETLADAVHGRRFAVLECRGRAVGLQAHPEKSGAAGLDLLAGLLEALGSAPESRGAN
jgi:imidazole glycerol phosphate synthase glutamine amidotransferase subunit